MKHVKVIPSQKIKVAELSENDIAKLSAYAARINSDSFNSASVQGIHDPLHSTNNNLGMVNENSINSLTPAITFNDRNIYTVDGESVKAPSCIDQTFEEINHHHTDSILEIMNNSNNVNDLMTKDFILEIERNAALQFGLIENRYYSVIDNIGFVFIERVNRIFDEKSYPIMELSRISDNTVLSIPSFWKYYNTNNSANVHGIIDNGVLITNIVSNLNYAAMSLYTEICANVKKFIVTSGITDENAIRNILVTVDKLFAHTMADMTYEAYNLYDELCQFVAYYDAVWKYIGKPESDQNNMMKSALNDGRAMPF